MTLFCIDGIYYRPSHPILFRCLLELCNGCAKLLGLPQVTVDAAIAAEHWSWSGTESETESEDENDDEDDDDDDDNAEHTSGDRGGTNVDDGNTDHDDDDGDDDANTVITVVIGVHKRNEDAEAIFLHMLDHCPAFRLTRTIDIGALYTLKSYRFLSTGEVTTPHEADLYRAGCYACLE